MSDWKAIAIARGLDLPDSDIFRFQSGLDSLEAALHQLGSELPDRLEPAITLSEAAVRGE